MWDTRDNIRPHVQEIVKNMFDDKLAADHDFISRLLVNSVILACVQTYMEDSSVYIAEQTVEAPSDNTESGDEQIVVEGN